jgi:hypothetical protein
MPKEMTKHWQWPNACRIGQALAVANGVKFGNLFD